MGTALLSFGAPVIDARLERSYWYFGSLITIHADAKDTGGKFGVFEALGRPGFEPPLHVHKNEDEFFYVLEGRLNVTRGNEQLVLEAGEGALLPRMVPHTFRVASDSARVMNYVTPGGFEGFFRTLGRPAEQMTMDPNPPAPDYNAVAATAEKFGITLLR